MPYLLMSPMVVLRSLVAGRLTGTIIANLFLVGVLAVRVVADSPDPDLASKVDALFVGNVRSNTPGAVVLVARAGKRVLERQYGLARVEPRTAVTADTRFRIGSITKQFTAAAILKLEEAGKLSVNDPISKFLPDWPRGSEVTLRHLLNHSSGIHNYTAKPGFQTGVTSATQLAALIASFKDDPYDFTPGTKFRYSNSGYVLLSHIIEKVTGESYASFLRKTFFEPLGMNDTGVCPSGSPLTNGALGYAFEDGKVRRITDWEMSNVAGAGNLYSTAGDLFRWNEALFGSQVLSGRSLTEAFTVGVLAGDDPQHPEDTGYGYGWTIDRLDGAREISHGGELAGFGAYLLRLPEKRLTVVVLLNCVPHLPGLQQWSLAREIARLALGPELRPEAAVIDPFVPSAGVLKEISGRYDMGEGVALAVTREGDRAFMEISGRPRFEILPRSDRTFTVKTGEAEATFVRNAMGRIGKVILKQAGERIDAPKLAE